MVRNPFHVYSKKVKAGSGLEYREIFKMCIRDRVNKKVLKVVEHVMRNEAVYGIDRFPPACMGIFHQPKRPIIQKKSER